ncbi:MAG: hypothetical protein KDA45_11635, partial [Planctomycetales bacterium]|nr:hypothetical protein [Planctomycetales bacterium]
MAENHKPGRLASFRERMRRWLPPRGDGNIPKLDLQVLEERILYSATPLPIDLAQDVDAAENSNVAGAGLDETQLLTLGHDAAAGGPVAPAEAVSSAANSLDQSLQDLDALLQQYMDHEGVAPSSSREALDATAATENGDLPAGDMTP